MNLETQITPELWTAIASSYESENYSHAIKDAMSMITEMLRDKSGLDGDGVKLVGQALGFGKGKQPKIKINKLETHTEQDVQRGLMFLLQGMYALVRNPRTHERLQDSRKMADTIILFIDYLLGFLGRSQLSFTIQDFLSMVIDPHFVPNQEYVRGLVDRIPTRKRGDTLIRLYRQLNWKQSDNFELIIKELLPCLTDSEVDDFLSVVSEDLLRAEKVGSATLVIKVLPGELWPSIQRMSRLRVEKMLLDELETAWYIPESEHTNNAASTWINRIAKHFLQKPELGNTIIKKLRMDDFDHHNFVGKYFMLFGTLPVLFEEKRQMRRCVNAIADSVKSGNEFMKDCVVNYISWSIPQEWIQEFVESLKDLTDPGNPEAYTPDGTPFLGKFVPQPNPASQSDNIPF